MPLMPNTIISAAQLTSIDGWTDDIAVTWAYTSATTFTVTGDQTVKFSKGTRIKLTQTTVKYFVVVASSFAAGTTTVTITGGSDYTFANAVISANYYSYAANPQGYPGWFAYTPTITGFSGSPATTARFSVVGNKCQVVFQYGSWGTSNATGFSVTTPIPMATPLNYYGAIRAQNNSVHQTVPGMFEGVNGSSTINLYTAWGGGAWTASGDKGAAFAMAFEF